MQVRVQPRDDLLVRHASVSASRTIRTSNSSRSCFAATFFVTLFILTSRLATLLRPENPISRRFLVPGEGVEPSRPPSGTADFKSAAYVQFRHPGGGTG